MLIIPDAPGAPAGDAVAAVRQLYARHFPVLRRYVERLCPDRASADDIVQETFIRAWRHLPQLSSADFPVRPWLFRVARNLLIDVDRAARSRPVTVRPQPPEEGRDDTGLDRVLDQQIVVDALDQLSPAHRAVLVETLLPGTHACQGRPPARHTRQHGTITAPLRTAGPPPGVGGPRSDLVAMILHRSDGLPAAADKATGPAATGLPIRRVEVTRKARCADGTLDPDEWFPVSTGAEAARREAAGAIAICMACPVRGACLELSLRRWTIGQHGVWGGLVAADRAALRRRWLASPHEYGRAVSILDRSWNGPSAASHAGPGGRPAAAAGISRRAVSGIRAVRMARALLRHLTAAAPGPEDIDARRPGRWLMADSARAWPIQAGTVVRRRAASRSRRAARSGGKSR